MKEFRYHNEISIPLDQIHLKGELIIPLGAKAIVVFSHGSGSSHLSPRNKKVAEVLQLGGLGTLLFDLLTPEEDQTYAKRFSIELLTARLVSATHWLEKQSDARNCIFGFFGASTGAAAALKASVYLPQIKAVVSRGGRPDLVTNALSMVRAATLLIVGGLDTEVLDLNRQAYDQLRCTKGLEIIEGATHLFEEYRAMDRVCSLANSWFHHHLKTG
ncbi:MAG: hypothetical protein BGO55_26495 [Sphingobacteriales bacterium 50-39]|nr:hypothetical protein [Sphingobacteriales bacterium]OJW56441.1 MAG: hypothetical protein BGO55_26495 [Sphingobacteriales bacterium 50-39]